MYKQTEIGYAYFKARMLMSVVSLYLIFSPILKMLTGIDLCIPCLWKSLLGFSCPGCGLTSAFMDLIVFDFGGAMEHNALIFALFPLGLVYLWTDFEKFTDNYGEK